MSTPTVPQGSSRDARFAAAHKLHAQLGSLVSRARATHDSGALRALAELRRAPEGAFDGGPASTRLLAILASAAPDDQATLHGLGAGASPTLAAAIVRRELDDLMLVAWLVASHRPSVRTLPGRQNGFGNDLRALQPVPPKGDAKGDAAQETGTLDRRVQRLLATRREDLARELRPLFSLLAKGGENRDPAGVDVARLVDDLGRWDQPGRPVQAAWAYQFWVQRPTKTNSSSDAEAAPATDDPQEDR